LKSELVVRAVDVGYGYTKWIQQPSTTDPVARAFPSIAPLAGDRAIGEALGHRRDTVEVNVNGVAYEVGNDARLAQGSYYGRNMDDNFCLSAEYMALVRGAMTMMRVEHIDLLVVGLPLSTFSTKKKALREALIGEHDLAEGKKVIVEDVLVLAQPHGALATHGLESGKFRELQSQRNLIVDAGSRTFDWLVSEGFKMMEQKSDAVNRGMIDVLEAVAAGVSQVLDTRYSDLERIDKALRSGANFTAMGQKIDLEPLKAGARRIAVDAVAAMRRKVDAQDDSAAFIDNIVVSGGGAFFFKDVIRESFPKHQLKVMPHSMMANVRGFQLLGTDMAESKRRAIGAQAASSGMAA